MVVRRHGFIVFKEFVIYFILLLVPWVIRWFLSSQFPIIWDDEMLHALIFLAGSIYMLFVVLFVFAGFLDYWLDVWVITTERIISIEQKGLFSRSLIELQLDRVQDVNADISGFVPTLLHYGNISVQAAGAVSNTILQQVAHADAVARKIMVLSEECRRRNSAMSG